LRHQHVIDRYTDVFGKCGAQFGPDWRIVPGMLRPRRHQPVFRLGRHAERILVVTQPDRSGRTTHGRDVAFELIQQFAIRYAAEDPRGLHGRQQSGQRHAAGDADPRVDEPLTTRDRLGHANLG